MSDRSDDTGPTPEVSGDGGTGQQPETTGNGEPTPPPTADTDDATRTAPAAATDATGPHPAPEPPDPASAAAAPSTAEDAAPDTSAAPPASDGTPTAAAIDDTAPPEPAEQPRESATVTAITPAAPALPADLDRTALLDRPNGTPFLTARGLSATGRQGPIFTDVTVTAHLGQLVAVCGDGGDSRSSLLLALTGRFAHHRGALEVDGQTRPGQIRRRFTIAQAGPPIRFEPYATVGACIKETTTVSKGAATRTNINAWLDRLAVGVDTGDTFGFLPRFDQIRFAIACAAACRTPAIAVDDTDTGLDTGGSERVFEALRTVADAGQLVIAACTRADPPADTVVDLRDQHRLTTREHHQEDPTPARRRRHERTRNGGPR